MNSKYRDPEHLEAMAEHYDINYVEELGPESNALALADKVDDDILRAKLVAGREDIPQSLKLISASRSDELMGPREKRVAERHPDYDSGRSRRGSRSKASRRGSRSKPVSEGKTLMPYTDQDEAAEELSNRGYEELVEAQYEDVVPRRRSVHMHPEEAVLVQLNSSDTMGGWSTSNSQAYAMVEDVARAESLRGARVIEKREEGGRGIVGIPLKDDRIEQLQEIGTYNIHEADMQRMLEKISNEDRYAGQGLERAAEALEQ